MLADLFPRSKLIFLLRDGRDVVDSWLDAYRAGSWAIPGGAFPVTAEGRIALIRWLSAVWAFRSRAVKRAFDARPPRDRILVRYETLRQRTSETLDRICERFALGTTGLTEVESRHRIDRAPETARGPGMEIRIATPGSWRDNLTRVEQAAMHEVLGEALEEFGYRAEAPATAMTAV
jgi:hypothetical protein